MHRLIPGRPSASGPGLRRVYRTCCRDQRASVQRTWSQTAPDACSRGKKRNADRPAARAVPCGRCHQAAAGRLLRSRGPGVWPHLRLRPLWLVAPRRQGRVLFQRHVEGENTPGLTSVSIPSSDVEPYFVCASEKSIPCWHRWEPSNCIPGDRACRAPMPRSHHLDLDRSRRCRGRACAKQPRSCATCCRN